MQPRPGPCESAIRARHQQNCELLEKLAKSVAPARDPQEQADALLALGDSIPAILGLPRAELSKIPGLDKGFLEFLLLLPQLMGYLAKEQSAVGARLTRVSAALSYMPALLADANEERCAAAFVDAAGKPLWSGVLAEGDVNSVRLPMRELARMALKTGAKAFVLTHNHPGGTLLPTYEDIDCTRAILAFTSTIGAPMLDHLIVFNSYALSLRMHGVIREGEWLEQAPNDALLLGWMGEEYL